ncbi:MAG: glycoside hydrolase family 31 protein [Lentisphaeria bacterium]|nr:glycoside hydrolase family 31 protein [Lentisphaeria bacterium]
MTSIERTLDGTGVLRLDFLTDRMARVRLDPEGRFADTGLNRYGFILPPDTGDPPLNASETGAAGQAATGAMTVQWGTENGPLRVLGAAGDLLLRLGGYDLSADGCRARFEALADEDWVGFGDQTRDRLYHRGQVADCHVRNVKSYIPVPFFMSTAGYGILVNTTHRVVFDMAHTDPEHFEWRDGRRALDFYVFVAPDFRGLLEQYTLLTGRPRLVPEWSLGLWYICRTQANDYEAVNDAVNFRREGIPCDVIGLEPGWMEKNYDGSVTKEWSKTRFPIPSYAQRGPHNFFNALQRLGYRMELWLCCDYDLSYEAERRIGQPTPVDESRRNAGFFQHDAEQDAHFSAPMYADRITRREEPWFEHLKKFVDQGAAFFKQDGAYQVLDHPDRRWGNGMDDAEMHNLYPLLYARQMVEGFENHTGRRGLSFTPCGWAGFQAWAGTWTGDTGGGTKTLGAMLNTALVGHSWATNDMEVTQKEALHFGYLLPWAQINSWNYFRMPWAQGPDLLEAHRFYSRLRARLVPYLYAWGWQASQNGFPVIAPLTLEFPRDPACREILLQFLLGRDLMVCAFCNEAYFPAGRWLDFWSGRVVEGPHRHPIAWPPPCGGGLFLREGAIVPLGPVMQYRGERPLDGIELLVFPGPTRSEFILYEDDGISLAHRQGAFALTAIQAERDGSRIRIDIGARQGTFEGMCPQHTWTLRVASDTEPKTVHVGRKRRPANRWSFDPVRREITLPEITAPAEVLIERA